MTRWDRKLSAWLHDPAEKALILLRDRESHERGTVKRLREQLDLAKNLFDHRADYLAAAADRPSWPRPTEKASTRFDHVDFQRHPELIHPLSGDRLCLPPINGDVEDIKTISQEHFESLIQDDDFRLTFLMFWRFGPEVGSNGEGWGELWRLLPADTRVPDHSIWSHVDTVSAIDTAMAGDADGDGADEPALLSISLGPVQGFISQARKTSDLWAGSHLLASLAWEAMRPIVEALGPDAVLFPSLRGSPVVDAWLLQQGGAVRELFERFCPDFLEPDRDGSHSLFAASLPNKFLAVVPYRQAKALAEKAVARAREAALDWALQAASEVFKSASSGTHHFEFNDLVRQQVRDQMLDYPEVHWAVARWPVASGKDPSALNSAAARLQGALAAIAPELGQQGVFSPELWSLLSKEQTVDGHPFLVPNSGVLYGSVHSLAERHLAAAKASRSFAPLVSKGFRCSITGDSEWLTHNSDLLGLSRTARDEQSVWGALHGQQPSWAKKGEHLGALATLKRLWPTLFAERVREILKLDKSPERYDVSTHALAVSTTLEQLAKGMSQEQSEALESLADADGNRVPLPRRVYRQIQRSQLKDAHKVALLRLAGILEHAAESADPAEIERVKSDIARLSPKTKPEGYYAVIQMDGDRLGAWLNATDRDYTLRLKDCLHHRLTGEFTDSMLRHESIKCYFEAARPGSPGRHAAISKALGDYSTYLAPYIVEDCFKGKLIYAGGDDVLALVAVDDLLDCMRLLQLAYSGVAPHPDDGLAAVGCLDDDVGKSMRADGGAGLMLGKGFAMLRDQRRRTSRLMRVMGPKATVSMGVVVVHHQAPLGLVLRQVRAAEKQAKDAGRKRFCLRVLKRSGGEVSITLPWSSPGGEVSTVALMKRLRGALRSQGFSRGVVYKASQVFQGLPSAPIDASDGAVTAWRAQLSASLQKQFERQGGDKSLASDLVDHICKVHAANPHPGTNTDTPLRQVEDFLMVTEFLSREGRGVSDASDKNSDRDAAA